MLDLLLIIRSWSERSASEPAHLYRRAGQLPSWPILLAVVVGLWCGTDLGVRIANRLERTTLHRILIGVVIVMLLYMTSRALRGGAQP